MTATLNPRERDPSRAYRLIEARLAQLEGFGAIIDAGTVTCSTSTVTTTVTVAGLASTDLVHLSPASSAAASDANGWAYVSAIAAGEFTVTHASNALTRTYRWFAFTPPS